MALGDCYTHLCASPLDFDSVLTGLFAENPSGCVGLKLHLDVGSDYEEPCENLTLQELILNSLVDDGVDGYALRLISVTATPECYPCATYDDMETLLKSLFTKQGDCYGIKYIAGGLSCTGVTPYSACGAQLTLEQLFKHAIGHADGVGNFLIMNQLSGACDSLDCQLNLTWDQIMEGLVVGVDGECYGALNLLAVDNRHTETSMQTCGHYLSFEDVFKASLSEIDCGIGINVLLINMPQ